MDLEVKNLVCTIDKRNIVDDVSLQVKNSSFVTILGPNGCGKSTLLKCIYRINKYSSGEIFLDNKDLKTYSLKQVAKQMAVVGQFNTINFDCSVYDVVLLGRTPHLNMLEKEKKEDYEICNQALKDVGMYEYKDKSYLLLSGGEKQRVVLARAIAQQPSLLLLDEPTNHLDIKYQLQILNIVKSLKINVLAVLHDMQLAYKYSDYLYIMKKGKFIYQGKKEEVITANHIKEIYDVDCTIIKQDDGNIFIDYK